MTKEDKIPLNICTWGELTDHPCLIDQNKLDRSHTDTDSRPLVFDHYAGRYEPFQGDVMPYWADGWRSGKFKGMTDDVGFE